MSMDFLKDGCASKPPGRIHNLRARVILGEFWAFGFLFWTEHEAVFNFAGRGQVLMIGGNAFLSITIWPMIGVISFLKNKVFFDWCN